MKNVLFLVLCCIGFTGFAQTDTEFCKTAQSLYDQNDYAGAMKAVNRALVKNPDAPCRRVRINAAMQAEESSVNYLQAISDLEYLMNQGDKSENNYKTWGRAEAGLGKIHFENKNFKESKKHYQKAITAFQQAKAKGSAGDYDSLIANADNQMKQADAQSKN